MRRCKSHPAVAVDAMECRFWRMCVYVCMYARARARARQLVLIVFKKPPKNFLSFVFMYPTCRRTPPPLPAVRLTVSPSPNEPRHALQVWAFPLTCQRRRLNYGNYPQRSFLSRIRQVVLVARRTPSGHATGRVGRRAGGGVRAVGWADRQAD